MEKPIHLSPPEELDSFTIFLAFRTHAVRSIRLGHRGMARVLQGPQATGVSGAPDGESGRGPVRLGPAVSRFWGPDRARFTAWAPYTSARLRLVFEDIRTLLRLKLPERPPHQGLAGLWEALGLMVFYLDVGHRPGDISYFDRRL
jgi:hypothetical protein